MKDHFETRKHETRQPPRAKPRMLVRAVAGISFAFAFSLFAILVNVAASSQSKPKDVLGWEGARWGMTADDIAQLFGSRAERVPSVKVYGDWYYLYTVPVNLQGERYTAILLMDYSTDKLARVDIRLDQYESPAPREDIFNGLEAMLTQQYGQPDSKKAEPRSDNWRIRRTWKFPTSTVELWLYWQKNDEERSNVGISYYPTAAVK